MATINEQLAQAVAGEDLQATLEALQAGADPNTRFEGLTPVLYIATRFGLVEIVEALLGAGADPDVTYGDLTPEMVAESELRSIPGHDVYSESYPQRLLAVLNMFRDLRTIGVIDRADAERRADIQSPNRIEDEAAEFAWTILSEEFGTNEFTLDDAAKLGIAEDRIAKSVKTLTESRIVKLSAPGRYVLLQLIGEEPDAATGAVSEPTRSGEEALLGILRELQCGDLAKTAIALEQIFSLPDHLDDPSPTLADALTSLGSLNGAMRDEFGNNPSVAVNILGRCPASPVVREALESIVENGDFDIKALALNELASKFDYKARLLELIARNEFWVSKSALDAMRCLTRELPVEEHLEAIALAAGLSETKSGAALNLSLLYESDGCGTMPPEELVDFVVEGLSDEEFAAFEKANLFETLDSWRKLSFVEVDDDRILNALRALTRSRDSEVRAKARETLSRFTKRAPSSDENTPEQVAQELVATPLALLGETDSMPTELEGAAAILYAVQCAAVVATRRSRYPKCEQELVQRILNAVTATLSPDAGTKLRQQLSVYGRPGADDQSTDAQVLEDLIPDITETYSNAIYESAAREISNDEYRQLLIPMLELLKDSFWKAVDTVDGAWGESAVESGSSPNMLDTDEFDLEAAARAAAEDRREYESRLPAVEEVFVLLKRQFGNQDFSFDDVRGLGITDDDANFTLTVLKDSGRLRTVALRTFALVQDGEYTAPDALEGLAEATIQDDAEYVHHHAPDSDRGSAETSDETAKRWWQFWRE